MGPLGGLDPAVLAAWVVASCREQGVPVKVTDAAVLTRVRVLLGGGQSRQTGMSRPGLND